MLGLKKVTKQMVDGEVEEEWPRGGGSSQIRSSRNSRSRSNWRVARYTNNASFELDTNNDVVRFSLGKKPDNSNSNTKDKKRKVKMSRKAKMKELRFYRLNVKKKMNSPNLEVKIRHKLEQVKKKESWLIKKLPQFKVQNPPAETYDPEILTEEEIH
ncbi:hypothetical protein K1719_023132 [Acacia pycnantha]|nr:hypothetical protein K1719_023132 [Acacia pycnantha]